MKTDIPDEKVENNENKIAVRTQKRIRKAQAKQYHAYMNEEMVRNVET